MENLFFERSVSVKRIGKLQNKAMRIINFEDFRASADPLYFQCEILKLCDMVRLANCLLVHDSLKNVLPDCFVGFVEQLKIKYIDFITRNSEIGNLFVPSVNKTSTGLQSITFRSIECWNKISLKYSIDLSTLSRIELKRLITGMCIHELNAVDESIYYYY